MTFPSYMDADYFRSGLARRVFLSAAAIAFNGETHRKVQRYRDDYEDQRSIIAASEARQ